MEQTKYKRVLLKLSGEMFMGESEHGIDTAFLSWLAKEIKSVTETGLQMAVVVGGGNFIRGKNYAEHGVERATADYMGMLATLINGMALTDTLEAKGQPTRLMTRVETNSVAEPYIRRRGLRHLEKNRVVVVAGGTGNPYVTTDTAAVLSALELHCEAVLKATNVDGVYDKDPKQFPDSKLLDHLSYNDALESPEIKVMDKTAVAMAQEQHLPIIVFNLQLENSIAKAVSGQNIGTKIS